MAHRHRDRLEGEMRLEYHRQKAATERVASLCSVIATVQTGKRHKPEQFLPKGHNREPGKPKRRMTAEETKDSLLEFAMKTQAKFGRRELPRQVGNERPPDEAGRQQAGHDPEAAVGGDRQSAGERGPR